MLTHYGCSPASICPGDDELLDIMLVDGRPRERGERLTVRVIDVLERRPTATTSCSPLRRTVPSRHSGTFASASMPGTWRRASPLPNGRRRQAR